MQNWNKTFGVFVAVAVLGVVGFQIYQNQLLRADLLRMQAQVGQVSQGDGSEKSGKKAQDPYLLREVKNTIVKNAKTLQECWFEFLKTNPELKRGSVYLDWSIKTDGTPMSVEVIRSDFNNEPMNQCLTAKIQTFTFPPPPFDQTKYIEYTLSFEREEDPKPSMAPELVTDKKKMPKGK